MPIIIDRSGEWCGNGHIYRSYTKLVYQRLLGQSKNRENEVDVFEPEVQTREWREGRAYDNLHNIDSKIVRSNKREKESERERESYTKSTTTLVSTVPLTGVVIRQADRQAWQPKGVALVYYLCCYFVSVYVSTGSFPSPTSTRCRPSLVQLGEKQG